MQELLLEVYEPEGKVSASDVFVEPDFGNEDSFRPSGLLRKTSGFERVSSDPHFSAVRRGPTAS